MFCLFPLKETTITLAPFYFFVSGQTFRKSEGSNTYLPHNIWKIHFQQSTIKKYFFHVFDEDMSESNTILE